MRQIFIDGAWVHAREGAVHDVMNPATLQRLGAVADCGPGDVTRAVAAARAAQAEWQRLPAALRAVLLLKIGGRVRAGRHEFAALMTQETGKPLCESIDCIDAVVALLEAGAAMATEAGDAAPPASVVAVVLPFNFPLLLMASAIAPALAAGSALVCKLPPQNPLTGLKLAEACDVLPPGVINVLTGGADTGRALVEHRDVRLVRFTGSARVGREIAAAVPHKQLHLEPGSNDAFIVCRDANLDATVPGIAWARLFNGGQACTSGRHVYVERTIAADFVERMHQSVGFLDVDDPMKPPTDLGPLISLAAANRVEDQVGRALREGAKLILGGRRFRPSGLPGHFFQPTILSGVPAGSVPTREEILGPVISITPVADSAEALRLASESGTGGASIYTSDPHAASRALEPFRTGFFRINDPTAGGAGPFGAMRHPDIRRALAGEGDESLRQPRHVRLAEIVEVKPWWFPYRRRVLSPPLR